MQRDPDHAGAAFAYQVHDALRHLHDLTYLHVHPLANLLVEGRAGESEGGRGRALQHALLDAIESMRPEPHVPAASRAWRTYHLLTLRFSDRLEPSQVRAHLAISRSEYFREQRRGLDAVTFAVRERWGLTSGRAPASVRGPLLAEPPAPGEADRFSFPIAPGIFVGRELELAEVQARLQECRLVTLTGAPGTGKTRLALEAAGRVRAAFPDGILFMDLTQLTDPELVVPALARLLRVRGEPGRPLVDSLQRALGDRDLLIVLDNCEHLRPVGPALTDLLQACPRARILVTSRARLHLTIECEIPVPPLPVPEASSRSPDEALQHSAVALFVTRARESRATFALTAENAPDVVEICARLDGLPLAIELAAARVRYLAPGQLLARMRNRLTLLTGGARDRPARQQTLRGAIAWGYDLLARSEQEVFRRLAVFSGGWTLEAAEAVLGSDTPLSNGVPANGVPANGVPANGIPEGADIFESLVTLVDNSLVREHEDAEGGPRFDMLGTIRDFAGEQLGASGEVNVLRQRHAAYFAALAAHATPAAATLDMLEREHDNLLAALDWFVDRNDAEAALQLALALGEFWRIRGYYAEGRARLAAALALSGERGLTAAHALALRRQGALATEVGDYAAGRACFERALELYGALGNESGVARTLHQLMRLAAAEGKDAEARRLGERSIEMLWALGEPAGSASVLIDLARLSMTTHVELPTARERLQEAVDIFRGLPDDRRLAQAFCLLGEVASDQGQYAQARRHFGESLDVLGRLRDPAVTAQVLAGLAGVAAAEASPEQALQLAGAADALRQRIGTLQPANWRRELERRVAPAALALDPAAREAAWHAGAQLSPQRAIALATEFAATPR